MDVVAVFLGLVGGFIVSIIIEKLLDWINRT